MERIKDNQDFRDFGAWRKKLDAAPVSYDARGWKRLRKDQYAAGINGGYLGWLKGWKVWLVILSTAAIVIGGVLNRCRIVENQKQENRTECKLGDCFNAENNSEQSVIEAESNENKHRLRLIQVADSEYVGHGATLSEEYYLQSNIKERELPGLKDGVTDYETAGLQRTKLMMSEKVNSMENAERQQKNIEDSVGDDIVVEQHDFINDGDPVEFLVKNSKEIDEAIDFVDGDDPGYQHKLWVPFVAQMRCKQPLLLKSSGYPAPSVLCDVDFNTSSLESDDRVKENKQTEKIHLHTVLAGGSVADDQWGAALLMSGGVDAEYTLLKRMRMSGGLYASWLSQQRQVKKNIIVQHKIIDGGDTLIVSLDTTTKLLKNYYRRVAIHCPLLVGVELIQPKAKGWGLTWYGGVDNELGIWVAQNPAGYQSKKIIWLSAMQTRLKVSLPGNRVGIDLRYARPLIPDKQQPFHGNWWQLGLFYRFL